MPDRGQSEVLGFALLFGTVVLMVLLIAAVSTAGLLDVRDDRRVDNAEVAMTVLSDNVDDLVRAEAPSRATEVDLDGGRLSLGDPVTVTVSGTSVDGSDPNFSETTQLRPLVYRAADDTELVYLNGAVVRDDGHGAAVVDGPGGSVSSDQVVLTLVRFEAADRTDAVGGDSVVTVGTARNGSSVVAAGGAYDVTIEMTSPRAAAWKRALESNDSVECSLSGDTVTCDVSTDRVAVAIVDVEVRFD